MSDDAPRGFVQMREYTRAMERIEELEAAVEYYQWLAGEDGDATDGVRVSLAAHRLGLYPLDLRFALRLLRQSGVLYTRANVDKVAVCRLRGGMRSAGGPAETIETIRAAGYRLTNEGRAFMRQWAPELFRPKAELFAHDRRATQSGREIAA